MQRSSAYCENNATAAGRHKSFVARMFSLCIGLGLIIFSCVSKSGDSSPKFGQYYVQGEQLYNLHCSNCHQKDGSGLGRVYPPVDTSDYMDRDYSQVICLIRNGIDGELVVNGQVYNQPMPAFPMLSDLEVAQIVTYIYNNWSHQEGLIDVRLTSKALAGCDSIAAMQ
jgi:hypothetical protein